MRRRTQSRVRPRTRWLAIEPDATSISANDSYNAKELVLQDGSGNVLLADLVGGTILRCIIDFTALPSMVTTGADESGSWTWHHGLFVLADTAPVQALWDPNDPHGEFMYRDMQSAFYRFESTGGAVQHDYNGRVLHVDTTQRRRIREGMKLWWTSHYFETGIMDSVAVGYNGRVLIQLP